MPDRARARPQLLLVRARRSAELLALALRGRWRFYLGLLAFALGAVGLVVSDPAEPIGFVTSVAGVVIGVVLAVPDLRDFVRDRSDVRLLAPMEDFVSPVPLVVPTGARVVASPVTPTNRALVWDEVDDVLASSGPPCRLVDGPRLPPDVERHRQDIVRERVRGVTAFNGKIIGQATDLTPSSLHAGTTIDLVVGRYYDLVATNYMTNWSFGPPIGTPIPGWTLSQDEDTGVLRPLAGSGLVNAIGVSTLAFTRDARLVLVGQANRSLSSPGTWAPSGSGSVDEKDVVGLRRGPRDLADVLVHTMERELQEEARVGPDEIGSTTLTGYFRWVNQGGKPEYVGVTLLSIGSEDLRRRVPRLEETPFVKRIDATARVDVDALVADPGSLACLPARYRDTASLPLVMALRALGRRLGHDHALRVEITGSPPD